MKTARAAVLRKTRPPSAPLRPISLRLPVELWEKCGWAAAAAGLDRGTFVRNTLTHATQGIERPKNGQNREILASQAEWEAWEKLAKQYDLGTVDLVRRLLNRAVERAQRS